MFNKGDQVLAENSWWSSEDEEHKYEWVKGEIVAVFPLSRGIFRKWDSFLVLADGHYFETDRVIRYE